MLTNTFGIKAQLTLTQDIIKNHQVWKEQDIIGMVKDLLELVLF